MTYEENTYPVTSIGTYAFQYCSGLTEVTIGNNVTSISPMAFSYCRGLTKVTIGNNVTSIGNNAFSSCSSLTELTIPSSVTFIDSGISHGCSDLEKITVESGNPQYDSRENCNAIIETNSNKLIAGCKNTIIPGSVTSIGTEAFALCTSLTELTIPGSVTSIGDYAFAWCSGLTELTILGSVTSIGDYAFQYCSGLTELTIPNSVTSIGNSAFLYCSGLTELTIPNSVTSIGNSAFRGCTGLTELTIPGSVTSIGNRAFESCSGLTTLYSLNTTPPSVDNTSAFSSYHYTDVDLFVPEEALEAYQTANVWKEFLKLHAIDATGIAKVSAAEQILAANGQITVTGLTDGTTVAVYDLSGKQVGTATSKGGQVTISTGMTAGAAAVVKVGERSVKTVMK